MATTRLVGEALRANGLAGSWSVAGSCAGEDFVEWIWRVLSQEPDMRVWLVRSYITCAEGAEWVERTVCSPVRKFTLQWYQLLVSSLCLALAQFLCFGRHAPPHIPVQSHCEGLIIVLAEAHVDDWGTVLEALNQLSIWLRMSVIQVDVQVPRGD